MLKTVVLCYGQDASSLKKLEEIRQPSHKNKIDTDQGPAFEWSWNFPQENGAVFNTIVSALVLKGKVEAVWAEVYGYDPRYRSKLPEFRSFWAAIVKSDKEFMLDRTNSSYEIGSDTKESLIHFIALTNDRKAVVNMTVVAAESPITTERSADFAAGQSTTKIALKPGFNLGEARVIMFYLSSPKFKWTPGHEYRRLINPGIRMPKSDQPITVQR